MAQTKSKAQKAEISYKDAMEELESIVSKVDDRGVDIDALAQNVKRAHELITICQSRIEAVRFEVENVMASNESSKETIEEPKEKQEDELF